jgi:predicted rRNA methylase YqxC with S4 and FtsJ domains
VPSTKGIGIGVKYKGGFIKGLGISFIGLKPYRIRGKKGNQEYFILSRL